MVCGFAAYLLGVNFLTTPYRKVCVNEPSEGPKLTGANKSTEKCFNFTASIDPTRAPLGPHGNAKNSDRSQ